MKKFAFCIAILLLLPAQTCITETQIGDDATTSYRKIILTGTIHTDHNEASVTDGQSITVFEYTGDYSIELWFPMAGGEAIQQRNTIVLTKYQPLFYGSANSSCQYTPKASAYQPRTFELDATLTLNGLFLEDVPVDDLTFQLPALPVDIITVTVLCDNGSPADIPDPTAYPQLLTIFFIDDSVNTMQLNQNVTTTREDYPVSPMYYVDRTETKNYTIVSSLD